MSSPELKVNLTNLRHYFGLIEDSQITNGNITYRVFLEGYHNSSHLSIDKAIGIPVFFGEPNTYHLDKGTRVYCLVQISDMTVCYIMGSVGMPDSKYAVDPLAKAKNSTALGTKESGVYVNHQRKMISLFSGKNSLQISSTGVSVTSNGKKTALGANVNLESDSGSFVISNNKLNITSNGSTKILSKDEFRVSANGITLDSNGGNFKIKSTDLGVESKSMFIGTGYFKLSASLGSAFTPGSTTIDISALKGNIFIGTAMGNMNMGLLSPVGTSGLSKYDFYIGTSQLKVASMNMTLSEASIALTPSGTFPVAALKSHITIKIQEITLGVVETPAGVSLASLSMGSSGVDVIFGKAPGGTAGAKMSLGASGASIAFGVSAAATVTKLNLGTSGVTLHGLKIDLKAPSDKAPAAGVVTKLTDPVVDNITGAPHIGSMTVSASS